MSTEGDTQEVTTVGRDGLGRQPLLDLTVAQELAVKARERHGQGAALGRGYGNRSATAMLAVGAASGAMLSSA